MKKAIQFGAGNIGRGFIGYLLSISGYHVLFADIDDEIINSINTNKKYLVEIVGEEVERVYVDNISAIHSLDTKLIDEISNVSLITTAVGPNILKTIAPILAKGIQQKYNINNDKYLNIIPCENMVGAGDYLKKEVEKYLNKYEREFTDKYVGFVNCVVDRIVPPVENKKQDVLSVRVEEFSEWITDKTGFKGEIPNIKDMEYTDNLTAYTERKIFTLNTGHAITAYLGYLNEYTTIRDSIMDPYIQNIVLGAMRESGEVLIKEYDFDRHFHEQYIQKILSRFINPYLKDDVTRVGRQPLRKLGNNDRLIKPLKGTIKYGLSNRNLITGIAAALSYDYPYDDEAVKMQNILKENPKTRGIEIITGLPSNSDIVKKIYNEYIRMKNNKILEN